MRWLTRLLTLVALLCFAAAAFDPVAVAFVDREPAPAIAVEGLAAGRVLTGAARAGARAQDLALRFEASATVPGGAIGAQVTSAVASLPIEPAALELRASRPPAVGRPAVLTLALTDDEAGIEFDAAVTVGDGAGEFTRAVVGLGDGPAEVEFAPPRAGRADVRIEAELGGQAVTWRGQLEIAPAPRVLVLEPGSVVGAALTAQGVEVDRAGAMTTDLSRYAAAVVGAPLAEPLQRALVAAIDDGLGVFVLAPAFGRPGEPLHDVLPVVPEPVAEAGGEGPSGAPDPAPSVEPPTPEQPPTGAIDDPSPVSPNTVEVDKRTIAMVLVVDRSGSMGGLVRGRPKMSYAKTSALQTARALAAGDQVGIVTFGNKRAGRIELPLTDAEAAAAITDGVERLAHGPENTCLLSGLQRADALLRPADAAVKHVVVITDGEFNTEETVALRALSHRMFRDAKISVTILSIVGGALASGFKTDAEMITREGGGEFFAIDAADEIPVFVSAEVTRSLDRAGRQSEGEGDREPEASDPPPPPPADEPEPEPEPEPPPPARLPIRAVADSPLLQPEPGDWPTLGSAVPTTAPLDARVLLVAGDRGWPLLAYGNRGLGQVGAFAADLAGDAGAELRAESAFPARLALWVQHLTRSEPFFRPQRVALDAAVAPEVPTPTAARALERLGGTELQRQIAHPEPDTTREVRSRIPDWALVAAGLLLLLVVVERVAVLRGRA